MTKKTRVLILCTGNSCRSQMAEGILRHYGGDQFEVFSAGTMPSQVNPTAIEVMKEIGIDISKQRSKHIDEFKGQSFDYVITVCENANPDFSWIFSFHEKSVLAARFAAKIFRALLYNVQKKAAPDDKWYPHLPSAHPKKAELFRGERRAKESCPFFGGGTKRFHWSFPDPSHDGDITPEVIHKFREVRDLIHEKFKRIVKKGMV